MNAMFSNFTSIIRLNLFHDLLKDEINLKNLDKKIFIYTIFILFTTHIYI